MSAAILQQAAGGALLGASSPAAADLACRAAVMAAPRLLGLMQRNYHSSAPRAPLHRPAAAAIASGSRGLSSYDKYASQLKDEEEKMRTKKQLAVASSWQGGGEQRRSARLAKKEAPTWVSVEAKAIKLRALKDALSGCSPRLKSKVLKDKLLDAVIAPMGMKHVSDLRSAASIPAAPVPVAMDD